MLGAVVCPVAGKAGAYLAQLLLRLPPEQVAQLMLFASLPPAALNYLLAERYQQEPERVASLVLIGNAFAIVFVPLGLTLGRTRFDAVSIPSDPVRYPALGALCLA